MLLCVTEQLFAPNFSVQVL